jgi:hypothetical protein
MTVVEELQKLTRGETIDPKRHQALMFDIPVTWEDAARKAVYQIIEHPFKTYNRLSDLRQYLDYLITQMGPGSTTEISDTSAAAYWSIFGSSAVATAQKNQIFDLSAAELSTLIMPISEILIRKQRDYGHENIARFGRTGLLVRTHDKVARLENLEAKQAPPSNESVVDNYIDVIGYSAIGIMWERSWFLLEMGEI